MNTAFLSLGGNLGDRKENLDRAITELEALCGRILRKSSLYETEAWGTSSKHKYLNMVLKLQTALTPRELLEKIILVEKKLGRKRFGTKVADRTIDIDILFFNKTVLDGKHLHIPHPRLELRKFVLIPFKEIEPEWRHPVLKKTIRVLLNECEDKLSVEKFKQAPKLRWICIEGNIGAGKTTLARALSTTLKAKLVEEKTEQNNLLNLFYEEPAPYATALEYSFLIGRYEQLSDALNKQPELLICDYSFYRSLIFGKVNLPSEEYVFFKDHFNALATQLPQPDLIIYLNTDVTTLQRNIAHRGRSYEMSIKDKYLLKIEKQYERKLNKASHHILPLALETYSKKQLTETLRLIKKHIQENFGGQKVKV
jgi:deoxyguanosine kinase